MTNASLHQDQARKLDIALAAKQGLDVPDVPPELRCKYPSKFCGNARAPKVDGELHRFCEFHRRRANVNQKRWTSVRRRLARESREYQKCQDRQHLLTTAPWMARPTVRGYFGPGAMSPTSGENFYAYDNTGGNPFSAAALSSPTLLPPFEAAAPLKPSITAPLDDAEIDILTTLLAQLGLLRAEPRQFVPDGHQPAITKHVNDTGGRQRTHRARRVNTEAIVPTYQSRIQRTHFD